MIGHRGSWLVGLTLAGLFGCSTYKPQLTYDRFDPRNNTYVNDTAGFALRFGDGWRVNTDVDWTQKMFALLPIPSATEVSLRAAAKGVGVWIETTAVAPNMSLQDLQPAIMSTYGEAFRQLRYTPKSLEKKEAHGIEYVEWVYQLRTPDFDQVFMEGLFVKAGYAVRIRSKCSTERFDQVRDRISRLMASLTAVDVVTERLDRE